MSVNLQIKRTKKHPSNFTDSPINNPDGIYLHDGEQLICTNTKLNDGCDCVIIGDGIHSIAELYHDKHYINVLPFGSNECITQNMLSKDCITNYHLSDNCITYDNIGEFQIIYDHLSQPVRDLFNHNEGLYNSLYDSLSTDLVYYGICSTPADEPIKEVEIKGLKRFLSINNDTGVATLDMSKIENKTLTIRFINGTTEKSSLKVNIPYRFGNESQQSYGVYSIEYPLYMTGTVQASDKLPWSQYSVLQIGLNKTVTSDSTQYVWQVVNTDALGYIKNWCYENNMSLINGGLIAADTITSNQIAANSISALEIRANAITSDKIKANAITSDKIATGAITADSIASGAITNSNLSEDLRSIISASDKMSSGPHGQILVCVENSKKSESGSNIIKLAIKGNDTTRLRFDGKKPKIGTQISVLFTTKNEFNDESGNPKIVLMISGNDVTSAVEIKQDEMTTGLSSTKYNWVKDDVRNFVYDGRNWCISLPTSLMSIITQKCAENNTTYIEGGNILTGSIYADTISANQITSGIIDASNIRMYASPTSSDSGTALPSGAGIAIGTGNINGTTTFGAKLYAGDILDSTAIDPPNYVIVTDGGARMQAKGTNSDNDASSAMFYVAKDGASSISIRSGSVHHYIKLNSSGISASTAISQTSDVRLKNTIDYSGLNKYEKIYKYLKPVTYMYNNQLDEKEHIGFIAQDIQKILDENSIGSEKSNLVCEVVQDEGIENILSIPYTEFIALNTHMIQKLQKEVEELYKKIKDVK